MNTRKKQTAVSHIIRHYESISQISRRHSDAESPFAIQVASDRRTRERAYNLAYHVYRDRGLVSFDPLQMVTSPWDATPHTLTLLAVDRETGEDAATMSIVLDAEGLPSQEIYSDEIDSLRRDGRLCVEVTRLAIAGKYRNSRELFIRMTNIISIFSRCVWHATDWVIEVNPRHAKFYKRFYLFEQIGDEKECDRVEGAPAVLMRMDLELQARVIEEVAGRDDTRSSRYSRTLYRRYKPYAKEADTAKLLHGQYRPMSMSDALYFGLQDSYSSECCLRAQLTSGSIQG